MGNGEPHPRESALAGPVLALDTTGSLGSVAVGFVPPVSEVAGSEAANREFAVPEVGGEVLETFEPSNQHARQLLPAIHRTLAAAGIECGGLVLLVATRGPGSFTGLRIGLATVQGLALAGETPAAGVSALDAAALADLDAGFGPRRRLALVDALRGELFAAVYDGPADPVNAAASAPVHGPVRVPAGEAVAWGREHGVERLCGPGVARYRDVLAAAAPDLEVQGERLPLAPAALRLGLALARRGDLALDPLYLREPDIHRGSGTL